MKDVSEDVWSKAWSTMKMGNAHKHLTHVELEL